MDARELYRFVLDSSDGETVMDWTGDIGGIGLDGSIDKRPLFAEGGVGGMHGLDLSGGRYATCQFPSPVTAMHAFVVYLDDGAQQQILMDDTTPTLELRTNSGASGPSIAVGSAFQVGPLMEVTLGGHFRGKVAEIVLFDRVLPSDDEQLVYDALYRKWIDVTPRSVPNVFQSLLGKTNEEVNSAVVGTAQNLNANFFNSQYGFRGDSDTIYNSVDGGVDGEYSDFHPEWLAAIFYSKDKSDFDKAITLMETYHWAQDAANGDAWYFYAKAFTTDPLHQTTYSGQGNHGYLGEVLYRAYARWRDPRYLTLADRTVKFWYEHLAFGTSNVKSYIFTQNDSNGYGRGIVKMFKNHILDADTYSEVTYMAPTTARMATEFGPQDEIAMMDLYDMAPHAQNQYFLRMAHPTTGLVPSTAMMNGTAWAHNGLERWARFCNDSTEKAFDRFLNSLLNYPQDLDANLMASLRKVIVWANGVEVGGVSNLLADYELDGSRDNEFHDYKNSPASEGMRASVASIASAVLSDSALAADMAPWVQDVWNNLGNTDRSLRGYARSVFTLSGAVGIENDALPRNYVPNPGFESADGPDFGWVDVGVNCAASVEAARRGSFGLSCAGGESAFPLVDASTLQAGATYKFSVWVRSASSGSTVFVGLEFSRQGTGDTTPQLSWPESVGHDWQVLSFDVTLPAGEVTTSIELKVVPDATSPSTAFHMDDVNVFLKTAAPPDAVQNLLEVGPPPPTTTEPPFVSTTFLPQTTNVPNPAIYVADIKMNIGQNNQGTKFNGRAWVTILEQGSNLPVLGAEVMVEWFEATREDMFGPTDTDGRVKFVSKRVNGGGTFLIVVLDVVPPPGYDYAPELNVMTSNSITGP